MDRNEIGSAIVIIIVAVLVFAAAFMLTRQQGGVREYNINGIKIVAEGNPQSAMGAVLAPKGIVMWIEAANETETVPCRQVAASEMALALGRATKNVTVQGRITSGYCIGAAGTKVACGSPQIIVRSSGSNSVSVDSKTSSMVVEGTDKWLCDTAPTLRNMIAWALNP